ncbi:MAG: DMT family transporter [Planctomycetota bacterium]|jgi:drug/metabolite transporter (DMT)-like permease
MNGQKRAYAYAGAAVLLWSTVGSAFKISLRHSQVLPLVFYSALTSTAFFFCLLLFGKKLAVLRTLGAKHYLRSLLFGFLNPFVYYVVLLSAYSKLAAQEALTLNFTWPIMLVLLSIPLLKQKIALKSALAILISFFGVFVIATKGHILQFRFTNVAGVLLALGSSVIWALYWIYNLRDQRDDLVKMFLNFAFGSLFITAALLLFSRPALPSPAVLVAAVYIGLFEMGITFVLWLKALKWARTTAHVANLIYLVPFLSVTVIHFAVGEKILASTIVGLVLIVTGIVLQKLE